MPGKDPSPTGKLGSTEREYLRLLEEGEVANLWNGPACPRKGNASIGMCKGLEPATVPPPAAMPPPYPISLGKA